MIIKKIEKKDETQTNGGYAHALLRYITQPDAEPMPGDDPDHKPHKEKCVHVETLGFSEDGLTPKQCAQEMRTLCRATDDGDDLSLISHWCHSWSKEDAPTQEQILASAKDHLADQGYGPDHMVVIGIHADTDNIHVHMATCRVSTATGKVLQEGNGWEKNEAQRAVARDAHRYGWSAPGCKFVATGETEAVAQVNAFTGEVTERQRPAVKKATAEKAKPTKSLRDRNAWMELKTGLRSQQGILQDMMPRIEITPAMKWGDIHKAYADQGIQIQLTDHGGRQGLVYSLDGEKWEAGSSIGEGFTLAAMEEKAGGSKYRHPRANVQEILQEARKDMATEIPTPAAEAKTPLSREQVQALRLIPIDDVRAKLGVEPTDSKKVRNGLDVAIHEMGLPYDEAVKKVAAAFPGVVSGEDLINTVPAESYKARLAASDLPESLHRNAMDAMKQIDAYGCERFHVYASGDGVGYTSEKKYPQGMTQVDLMKEIPNLARLNAGCNAHIYFAPVHAQEKISIPVDDVNPILTDKYRPSLTLATSDRSKQAHYVVVKKYEHEFYDWLTKNVNEQYGDKKIVTAEHDTRLCGFTNRKQFKTDGSEEYPYAKVIQHTPVKCTEFEKYVDQKYTEWQRVKHDRIEAVPGKIDAPADKDKAEAQEKLYQSLRMAQNMTEYQKRTYAALEREPVPGRMDVDARNYQTHLRKQYGPQIDRSKADSMIARHMYDQGATPNQVYTWMKDHMTQDATPVQRRHTDGKEYTTVKNASVDSADRAARRVATNMMPKTPVKAAVSVEADTDRHSAMLAEKRAADSLTAYQRQQANASAPAPVPTCTEPNRDKQLAQDAAVREAEAARLAKEAEAKAKAEEAAAAARAKEAEDRAARIAARKAAQAKPSRPKFSHGHGTSYGTSHNSGPKSGPKM